MEYLSFKYRLILGLAIFGVLGLMDLIKNPSNPKRLKEYGFLFSITGLAMCYGLVHDFITYSISPEYYIYGKEIDSATNGFNADVAVLALKATWSAGLIIGAAFLIANNPRKDRLQLGYKTLYGLLIYPLSLAAILAVATGMVYHYFAFTISTPWSELFNPQTYKSFMTTWGVHTGSYAGGLLGLIAGVIRIIVLRKRTKEINPAHLQAVGTSEIL